MDMGKKLSKYVDGTKKTWRKLISATDSGRTRTLLGCFWTLTFLAESAAECAAYSGLCFLRKICFFGVFGLKLFMANLLLNVNMLPTSPTYVFVC